MLTYHLKQFQLTKLKFEILIKGKSLIKRHAMLKTAKK